MAQTNLFKGTTKEAEDLLRDGGFMIDVHFRKAGTSITISPQLLGVDLRNNEPLKEFFSNFIESNKVSFLGKNNTLMKKALSIAKSAHKMKISMSLDGKSYMTKEILGDYKDFLMGKEKEFYEVRDSLVKEYDEHVHDFREKMESEFLTHTLSGLSKDEREEIIDRIMARVPSKAKFYSSFRVEMNHSKFALSEEVGDDAAEYVLQETVNRVHEITGRTLAVVFSQMNILLNAMGTHGRLTAKHRNMMDNLNVSIQKRNIFRNAVLEDMRQEIADMSAEDDETIAEMAEELVSRAYCYAIENGTEEVLDLDNSQLTIRQMELLGSEQEPAKTV